MSIPSTLISGFIGLASCGYMGARILHSLWLIEVDPHRGGSISLRPVLRTALPPPFIPPAPVIRAPVPSSPPCLPSPLPALLGRCTAINNEFTTGDKRRFFGGKIQHAIGDICGRAGSAKGDPP